MQSCRLRTTSTSGLDPTNELIKDPINSKLNSLEITMKSVDKKLILLNNNNLEKTYEFDDISLPDATETTGLIKPSKYTKNQWKLLFIFPILNFISGACFALQAPFFPKEAELKGVSPSVYGFTIGIFHLAILIVSPVCGKYINRTGAKFMINAGNYITAFAVISFGLLDYIPHTVPFITFAFGLRIAQGIGNAAFTTACYAIAAMEFPDNISGIASLLQIAFALGRIVGPAIGGLMYQAGGYMLPFVVIGGILFIASFATAILLPPLDMKIQNNSSRILVLLTTPSIVISTFQVVALMTCYGFLTSTLEPHLRQFNLQPSLLGLMFIIDGITGSIANAFWGYIAKKNIPLKLLSGCSAILLAVAFFIIGPAPFIPVQTSLWMIIVALVLVGLNLGGLVIIPYVDNTQEVIRLGYPKTIETFAIISGLWNSSVNLGAFIGSSVSGVMFDEIGFRWSSMLLVILQLLGSILCFGYYFFKRSKRVIQDDYVDEI